MVATWSADCNKIHTEHASTFSLAILETKAAPTVWSSESLLRRQLIVTEGRGVGQGAISRNPNVYKDVKTNYQPSGGSLCLVFPGGLFLGSYIDSGALDVDGVGDIDVPPEGLTDTESIMEKDKHIPDPIDLLAYGYKCRKNN
ncbi:hypothetical protein pdam_00008781 [Pocillopora damicornis]|uniref:Uncharacterized protein n=1 Tax=Pocillopora damicornis TaxID=46731 RepID=A0A3M6UAL2_POCDA|nr:hypothetical protein pdam_00008781 [Pocillopora damicornis]